MKRRDQTMKEFNELIRAVDVSDIPSFARSMEVHEFAPSMEIQAEEIHNVFCEIPELSFDKWQELSIERRVELLGEFEKKVAEIEMRAPLSVHHEATIPALKGYFDGNKIVISDNVITQNDKASYREVLNTLFHEGRHAYQFHNIFSERTERNDELFKSWDVNIKQLGYQPSKGCSLMGYNRYFCQPVEVDARVFAEVVMRTLKV